MSKRAYKVYTSFDYSKKPKSAYTQALKKTKSTYTQALIMIIEKTKHWYTHILIIKKALTRAYASFDSHRKGIKARIHKHCL